MLNEALWRQLETMQKLVNQHRPFEDALRWPSAFNQIGRLLENTNLFSPAIQAQIEATRLASARLGTWGAIDEALSRSMLANPALESVLSIQHQFSNMQSLQQHLELSGALLALRTTPLDVGRGVVAQFDVMAKLLGPNRTLFETADRLTASYLEFYSSQASRVATSPRPAVAEAILEAATAIQERTLTDYALLGADATDESSKTYTGLFRPNIYPSLNRHAGPLYAGLVDEGEDPSETVDELLPSRTSSLGHLIVRLVCLINQNRPEDAVSGVFTTTSKSMLAAAQLPTLIADTEVRFGEIVDALYFLLYEGSGAANRLTSLASDDELLPLWRLKHLRLDFRHDIEHGSRTDIRRKRHQVSEAYRQLGRGRPRCASAWKLAQNQLYSDIAAMLEIIADKLDDFE